MPLTVATCQFPVSADVPRNLGYLLRQMRAARDRGADAAHFCEGALSGYAGVDFQTFAGFDWPELRAATERVLRAARDLGLWVVLGSAHQLSEGRKPHNSVYLIDDRGQLVDRYDKQFCAGDPEETAGDLAHYAPGEHFAVFEIRSVRCGVLICHEYRYPELYRQYKRRGVALVFHSFHAANVGAERLALMRAAVGAAHHGPSRGTTLPEITMPASLIAAAASSHVWISASNSSARESCWPAFFVRADGVVTGKLKRNVAGVLISEVDTEAPLYDSTIAWRGRAMDGVFHSGEVAADPRSDNRREL